MAAVDLADETLFQLQSLLWPNITQEMTQNGKLFTEDVRRWHNQGFIFNAPDQPTSFGLQQGHGGPCGVLAPIQAEILQLLLFERTEDTQGHVPDVFLSSAQQAETLIVALSNVLQRVVVDSGPISLVTLNPGAKQFQVHVETDPSSLQTLIRQHLKDFASSEYGVVLLMYSVLLSRGIERIRNDMDDRSSHLTGQFGHCTQELLNLLLSGQAVSNVFDGSVPLGDCVESSFMMLRGIQKRNKIGYLTHLESLRYCQVGSFYKTPDFPIWVIGSSSHFTVLFGRQMDICTESKEQKILSDVTRIFQENDPQQNGFVPLSQLGVMLRALNIHSTQMGDAELIERLAAKIQVPGADIVLWGDFWCVVSTLLAYNDVERALNVDTNATPPTAATPTARIRSDSDIARELQAQFDGHAVSTTDAGRTRSDSDVARELQAQFDAESSPSTGSSPTLEVPSVPETKKFDLYHYNGLVGAAGRSARCVGVTLTLEIPKIIGTKIALNGNSRSGGHGCPIDDVIHSKWPDAKIQWQETPPPSLD